MDIVKILVTNYPGAQWSLDGLDYSGLEWLDDTPKPTEAELEAQWSDVQYQIAYQSVKEARHAAYTAPDGSDALLAKYQLGEDGVTLDMVKARKDEINALHPYPTPPES